MEGTKDVSSNTSNNTAAALAPSNSTAATSAPHNHQQEEAVVVPSLTGVKGQAVRNTTKPRPQQEVALECPRCSSKNTKFCYYNNYNLNQPRYFCKNCRRYWTQGGTLRVVPIGGGCRRNKRASGSSSSSAASSTTATTTITTATSAVMENTVKTQLMLTAASTKSMPRSPTTGLIPNDMLPTLTPVSGVLDVAMEEQQGFLPFVPLSLSDNQALELAPGGSDLGFLPFAPLYLSDNQASELAPGGSDMTPTFLDMLSGGYFDAGSSSYYYDDGLSMGDGSNAMDMSFLLPGMWPSATDPMQTQLLEGIDDVAGELQWTSAELDSYFNNDGGYAAGPAAGVEQQQRVLVGDQQEDDNKAKGAEG